MEKFLARTTPEGSCIASVTTKPIQTIYTDGATLIGAPPRTLRDIVKKLVLKDDVTREELREALKRRRNVFFADSQGVHKGSREERATLDSVCEEVVESCTNQIPQFGFITKKKAKVLYHPDTKLVLPAAGYDQDDQRDLNNQFYEILLENLAKRVSAKKEYTELSQEVLSKDTFRLRREHRKALSNYKSLQTQTAAILTAYTLSTSTLWGKKKQQWILDSERRFLSELTEKPRLELQIKKDPVSRDSEAQRDFQAYADKTVFGDLHQLIVPLQEKELVRTFGKEYHVAQGDSLSHVAHALQKELREDVYAFETIPYLVIGCDSRDAGAVQQHLAKSKVVHSPVHVERDHAAYIPELVDETQRGIVLPFLRKKSTSDLWSHRAINVEEAQNISRGSGSSVGIIDTGVDYKHSELYERFNDTLGYDFISGSNDPFDDHSHGTHVGGTVAGKVVGVAPEATLYALKVLNRSGFGSTVNIIRALEWCITHDVDVANMSLGSSTYSQAFQDVVNIATQRGTLCVAASGNSYHGAHYPAAYDNVIATVASTPDNIRAPFSNIWKTNDVTAPGQRIYSTTPNNGYDTKSGTSMASPHMAGVAALAFSLEAVEHDEVMNLLQESCIPFDSNKREEVGFGLLQADAFLTTMEGACKKRA